MLHKVNPASNAPAPAPPPGLPQEPAMAAPIIQPGQIPPQAMVSKPMEPPMPNHPAAMQVPSQPLMPPQGIHLSIFYSINKENKLLLITTCIPKNNVKPYFLRFISFFKSYFRKFITENVCY